jgi:Ca2+-transporting ATPase
MQETFSIEDTLKELKSNEEKGLSQEEAAKRLSQYGPNKFASKKRDSVFIMFLKQFNDPMIYILIVAAVISLTVGLIEKSSDWVDSIIIFFVVLLNAFLGTIQEDKANKAMDSLKKMSSPNALVRRDGLIREVKAEELVPGDVVLLEEGNIIPADVRLLKTSNFKTDESSLTGESVPVLKDASLVFSSEVPLGDRLNLAYMSTICVYGHGEGVVIGTGMKSEIG